MESLIKMLSGEPTYKEFKYNGHSLEMRTLTGEELDMVVRRTQGINLLSQGEIQKIPILGYALVKIDGCDLLSIKEVREDLKKNKDMQSNEAVEKIISQLDKHVINALYDLYISLSTEVMEKVELLKNVSKAQSPDSSGNSIK